MAVDEGLDSNEALLEMSDGRIECGNWCAEAALKDQQPDSESDLHGEECLKGEERLKGEQALKGEQDPSDVQDLQDAVESALQNPFFLDDNVDANVDNWREAIKDPAGFYYSIYYSVYCCSLCVLSFLAVVVQKYKY